MVGVFPKNPERGQYDCDFGATHHADTEQVKRSDDANDRPIENKQRDDKDGGVQGFALHVEPHFLEPHGIFQCFLCVIEHKQRFAATCGSSIGRIN